MARRRSRRLSQASVKVRTALAEPDERNILDIYGSDLPDEYFEGIFDEQRQNDPPGERWGVSEFLCVRLCSVSPTIG